MYYFKEVVMNNFNFSVIEGYLAKDPVFETVGGKHALCKFTVGSNRSYTNKAGEKVEESSFFDVTTWYKLAEVCSKYLHKGSRVLVSGNLRRDTWKDKDERYQSRVYLEGREVNFLTTKKEAQAA